MDLGPYELPKHITIEEWEDALLEKGLFIHPPPPPPPPSRPGYFGGGVPNPPPRVMYKDNWPWWVWYAIFWVTLGFALMVAHFS